MPVLLIDKKKCLENIERMARKASEKKLRFRPHFKTHQSVGIGNWFRQFGVTTITVSSFRMASYFARAGWKEILVAFPFNPHDLSELNALSGSIRISILLDNPDTLPFLDSLSHPVDFYIDIDTGYGRTGVKSEDHSGIERLLTASRKCGHLIFKGFYCHAGHSYKAADRNEKDRIHQKAVRDLAHLKQVFSEQGPLIFYGDTPNCSIQDDFTGIDAITPGNFVFYDLMQYSIGSCSLDQVAVAMACPVTGKYPDNQRIVIHGGAVHFSKEALNMDGRTVFGKMVDKPGSTWSAPPTDAYITAISQEHGLLEHTGNLFGRTGIGEILHFLPVHSCLAANLMREYHTLDGERITTLH